MYWYMKKSSILIKLLKLSLYNFVVLGFGFNFDEYFQNVIDFNKFKQKFIKVFVFKIQDEWIEIFKDTDVCCILVLELGEVFFYFYNVINKLFFQSIDGGFESGFVFRLFRTFGVDRVLEVSRFGQYIVEIFKELGFLGEIIQKYIDFGVVF